MNNWTDAQINLINDTDFHIRLKISGNKEQFLFHINFILQKISDWK